MNSLILSDLIYKSKANPYVMWPGVSTEKSTIMQLRQLNQDEPNSKSFIFEANGIIYLYFQVHLLEWDSNHFGYKCAVIKHFHISDEGDFSIVEKMAEHIMPLLKQYLNDNEIRFLFSDIPSQSSNGNHFIQLLGFKFILNWVDGFLLTNNVEDENTNLEVMTILPEEIDIMSNIAAASYYKGGRFYSDKIFSVSEVGSLYGDIIKDSFLNNDIVLVCRVNSRPVGVFVCKAIKNFPDFSDIRVARLRFLVLDPDFRGNLFGYRIFKSTVLFLKNKCDMITTGLETHNLISLNLHIKMGFKFNYSHNAYHLWNKSL